MTDLRLEVSKTSFLYDFKYCPLCGAKLFINSYLVVPHKRCTNNFFHCDITCEEVIEENEMPKV